MSGQEDESGEAGATEITNVQRLDRVVLALALGALKAKLGADLGLEVEAGELDVERVAALLERARVGALRAELLRVVGVLDGLFDRRLALALLLERGLLERDVRDGRRRVVQLAVDVGDLGLERALVGKGSAPGRGRAGDGEKRTIWLSVEALVFCSDERAILMAWILDWRSAAFLLPSL